MADIHQDIPQKWVPPKHRNNNDPTAQFEAGLAAHKSIVEERDQLKSDLDAAKVKIKELETALEMHERDWNKIEARVNVCVAQRDAAVREAGELHGMLDAIEATIAAAKREATPIEQSEDAEPREST
jgi:chromosome segregation ATPase